MSTWQWLLLINYIICALIVLHMIFVSQKKFERIFAWATFLIVPFVGLFFYLLIGTGLNLYSKRMIKRKAISSQEYNLHIKKQIEEIKNNKTNSYYANIYREHILLNLNNCDSILTDNNQIDYYNDGVTMVDRLLKDIEDAKSSIHMQFYIYKNDRVGKKITQALTKKAQEGVEVRLLYDAVGSMWTSLHQFRKLKKAGGQVAQFFPPFLNIKLFHINANYRNHRKIVVIDGKIGYTGGTNIREDHLSYNKKLSPWRDTNIRITGDAVHSLQNLFLSDWRYSISDKNKPEVYLNQKYFPTNPKIQNTSLQVISSGPDDTNEAIKECMIKMIVSAKRTIRIQTPYFIPDDVFMGAIKLAIMSGVSVEIIIPKKVDHWTVHFATMSYINDVMKLGAKCYIYNGFIHSKCVIVDDLILTLGSCNIDIRSFQLNFEDNVVVYSKDKVQEYSKVFDRDLLNCKLYTETDRKRKNIFVKIFTSICRLLSSIL